MELSIVIINWNSQALLQQCLGSIHAQCRLQDTEIVVVDNGSFDGCDRMLATAFPRVRFLQSLENVGFARANNLGARHTRGRQLLFLNPDTILTEDTPALLSRRLATLPHAGAIGCRLLNADRSLQTSCLQSFPTVLNQLLDLEWLRRRCPRSRLWGMAPLFEGRREPSRVAAISGACLAVTREAFEDVGGFTEAYFMYGEDLDLCRKLHTAGWSVYFTPATSLIHLGGGSSRRAPGAFAVLMRHVAVHRFIRIHEGPFAAGAYRAAMAFSALVRLGLLRLPGLRSVTDPAGARGKWRTVLRWSLGLLHEPAHLAPPPVARVAV